ncbi:hypothetical protein BOTCAL_0122g00130 [Botryotinia calthae]|uniref:Protein kinase domain-containing protein n=1 Tax=Botryotinia calthae TaxID=38488 RepID=A0A4Y8D4F5_9HELO|nr:hypothetical protein BOTCAL_0122g00130 [Botryotinia calthae]
MSTTVRDVLSQHAPGVVTYRRLAANASLSKKKWTNTYSPIMNPTVRVFTYDSVNQFFGLEQYLLENRAISVLYTTDTSESGCIERLICPLNHLSKVCIWQEGDTVRDFFPLQNIAFPVSLAWNGDFFLERLESGTLGLIDHNKTVDHLDSGKVAGSMESESESEIWEVVGELKQHGNILIGEWKGINAKTDITIRLGREIRAMEWLDVINSHQSGEPAVLLGGFTRELEYWSGWPFWRDANGHKVANHPGGYYRAFDVAISTMNNAIPGPLPPPPGGYPPLPLRSPLPLPPPPAILSSYAPSNPRYNLTLSFKPYKTSGSLRKLDLDDEFKTENGMFHYLKPFQGTFILKFYGEANYDGSPALVLSEIFEQSLHDIDFDTRPGADAPILEAKLQEASKVLIKYGVFHGDPELHHIFEAEDRIIITDLE